MLAYTAFMLITRYIAAYDSAEVTLTYSMFAGVVIMAPFAIDAWVWPVSRFDAALGDQPRLLGRARPLHLHPGLPLAPASTLAPFIYMQLLTMTILGFLVFGDLPDRWTLIGAAIVIASGIYLVHRERVRRRRRRRCRRSAAEPASSLVELEHVARAAHGAHRIGLVAADQRLAQPTDMDIDGALVDIGVAAPDAVEQLRARQHPPRALQQEFEQPELGRSEPHLRGAARDAMRARGRA